MGAENIFGVLLLAVALFSGTAHSRAEPKIEVGVGDYVDTGKTTLKTPIQATEAEITEERKPVKEILHPAGKGIEAVPGTAFYNALVEAGFKPTPIVNGKVGVGNKRQLAILPSSYFLESEQPSAYLYLVNPENFATNTAPVTGNGNAVAFGSSYLNTFWNPNPFPNYYATRDPPVPTLPYYYSHPNVPTTNYWPYTYNYNTLPYNYNLWPQQHQHLLLQHQQQLQPWFYPHPQYSHSQGDGTLIKKPQA